MYNAAIITLLFAAILESLIIIVGNIFAIFVFWKHRTSLKRTFLLVINLAVADLFVGFTEPISIGAYSIPGHLEEVNFNSARNKNILAAFQITFGFASVFFLTLISLERAYALIWPLRHRVASTKVYSYSATLTWIAAILAGIMTLLTVFNVMDSSYWKVAIVSVKVLCLVTISVSYLAIRARLNFRVPAINGAHIRKHEPQQNMKLSRTLDSVYHDHCISFPLGSKCSGFHHSGSMFRVCSFNCISHFYHVSFGQFSRKSYHLQF